MLQFLREKCTHDVKNMEMITSGAHGANFEMCMAVSLKTRVTSAAVLGIAKCFPYELPSLSNTSNDLDPYAQRVAFTKDLKETSNFSLDMYGVGSQCNSSRVPSMSYPGTLGKQRLLTRHAMSVAYVITGMLRPTCIG